MDTIAQCSHIHIPPEVSKVDLSEITYLGYVIGERAWQLKVDSDFSPYIMSLIAGALWPSKTEIKARCLNVPCLENNGKIFTETCKQICGIYAFKKDGYFKFPQYAILGEVALWGKITIHEFGYRAECAYPLSFKSSQCWRCNKRNRIQETNFHIVDGKTDLYPLCQSCLFARPSNIFIDGIEMAKRLSENYGVECLE